MTQVYIARVRIDPLEWLAHADGHHPRPHVGITNWFPGTEAPTLTGWYERLYTDGIYRHWFNAVTGQWYADPLHKPHWRQVGDYPAWRGLAEEPPQPGFCKACGRETA